mgnify:CR=1 FL=1|jgi:mRNA-degrading endonuclease YafQ of YafQ-DinJ toxin-antitoxin module
MQKKLKKSTQFKKDLKKYIHKPSKLLTLKTVTKALEQTGRVTMEWNTTLTSCTASMSIYEGCMECHAVSIKTLYQRI